MTKGFSTSASSQCQMLVVGVAVALALASSATRGLDPDLRAQDISTPRPLILAHVVSGSEGGQADGIYSCVGSAVAHPVATCVHLQEPLLRLERHQTRRTIFSGGNPVYQATTDQTGGIVAIEDEEEHWVWLRSHNEPPRDVPTLTVRTVRDIGCSHDAREDENSRENGQPGVLSEAKSLEMQQLGDVYHRAGRLSEAAACYTGALRASPRPPDRRQRCHLRLALCTVNASEIARKARMRGGGGGNQLSSSREQQQRVEAECFAALLLDEKGECSEAVDEIVQEAHISVGVFRLCEEWDVGGALNHFLMATVNQRRVGSLVGEEDEEEENRSVPQGGDVGWGAVWLAQTIQGRAQEASTGFKATAAALGKPWARDHLQSWRRRLGRSCSGIGMTGVVEGAERLIVAGAGTATTHQGGADGRDNDTQLFAPGETADLHLTLSRTLLLLGASGEADSHVRAVERLPRTENITAIAGYNSGGEEVADGSDGRMHRVQHDNAITDAAALRLEVELLSRTPVVLEAVKNAASLRRSLLVQLKHLTKAGSGFSGSIPSPLEVGLRAQFLATYQGLNDKALASALTMAFDKASGGALSYYSPNLLWEEEKPENSRFDVNYDTGTTNRDRREEQEPPCLIKAPQAASSAVDATSQPHEGSEAATSATKDKDGIRVGFLSAHFRWHSVGRLTVGLLERLSNSCGLEIIVLDASIDGRSITMERSSPTLQGFSGEQGGGGDPIGNPIIQRLKAAGASIVWLPAAAEEAMAKPSNPAGTTAAAKHFNSQGTSNNVLQNAQKAVAALKLDVVVYCDVGMDARTTGLAHGRFSPVQVAFWGHPGTTGLSTMDYFITSDLFEGELGADPDGMRALGEGHENFLDANAKGSGMKGFVEGTPEVGTDYSAEVVHGGNANPLGAGEKKDRQEAFSEQLVRLGGLGIVFDDPAQTFHWDPHCGKSNDLPGADTLSRKGSHDGRERAPEEGVAGQRRQHHRRVIDGGAPPGEGRAKDEAPGRPRLYVCAQSLMKMHPAFDAVLTGILAADPLAHILLLRDPRQLLWHSRFRRRLRAAVDAAERQNNKPPAVAFDRSASGTANATAGADPSPPFKRQPGNFWSRVRFLSPLSGREFFRLQCRADVVLDPFPFGGGVTTLEALACGTPVVTAGALQSVHRLAEGMIVAATGGKRRDANKQRSPENADEAGGAPTKQPSSAGVPGGTAQQGRGRTVPEEVGGKPGNDDGHTTRRSHGDGQSPGGGGVIAEHCLGNANDDNDAHVLVENLVAKTARDYVEKAMAVAAPGELKERVRRALCSGRDGMLRGNGDSVATDWERFLKRAAASAPSWIPQTEG